MGNIWIMADIHGSSQPIRQFYNKNKEKITEDDIMIILGDAGLNYFFNERDNAVKAKLGKYPFTYFLIRGNHEDRPSNCWARDIKAWHVEKFFEGSVFVENKYPYIKYAMDIPSVYKIAGLSTLVLPGAYSVDKFYRIKNNWSWFEDEQMNEMEMSEAIDLAHDLVKGGGVDLVLSHTAPVAYEPTDLFLPVVDQSTVDKTTERLLGRIEWILPYKLWFFGHYHQTRFYPKNGGRQIIMLYHEPLNLIEYINKSEE